AEQALLATGGDIVADVEERLVLELFVLEDANPTGALDHEQPPVVRRRGREQRGAGHPADLAEGDVRTAARGARGQRRRVGGRAGIARHGRVLLRIVAVAAGRYQQEGQTDGSHAGDLNA